MTAGVSSYYGDKITKHIERRNEAIANNRRIQKDRYILSLIQLARERGFDLSKLF